MKIVYLIAIALTCSGCAKRENLAGTWLGSSENGEPYTLTLYPDGTGQGSYGPLHPSLHWEEQDNKAYLYYSNGFVDVIQKQSGGFTKTTYAPGAALELEPVKESTVQRVRSPFNGRHKRASWSHRLVEAVSRQNKETPPCDR